MQFSDFRFQGAALLIDFYGLRVTGCERRFTEKTVDSLLTTDTRLHRHRFTRIYCHEKVQNAEKGQKNGQKSAL